MVPPWLSRIGLYPASAPYHPLPYTFTSTMSRTTEFDYDNSGKRIGMTDYLGRETSYAYDAIGRLKEMDHPVKGLIEYTYNVRGNKLSDEGV